MARIVKTVTQKVFQDLGFVCDACGKQCLKEAVEEGIHIDYSFGYGTVHDMTSIEVDICDACFFDLIKKNVHGAIFTNHL